MNSSSCFMSWSVEKREPAEEEEAEEGLAWNGMRRLSNSLFDVLVL